MMRAYEFMIILDGDLEEAAAQAWVKSVTDASPKPAAGFTASPIGGAGASSLTRSTRRSTATTP